VNVDEFEFLGKEVGADAEIVFDVGAKYGRDAGQFLRLFPKAKIYAVDCAPGAIERLRGAFHSSPRVEVVPLAFLNVYGDSVFPFHLCEMSGSSSVHPITPLFAQETRNTETIQVRATTLDEFCEGRGIERIDLLKIDTEGSDLAVLQGAQRLLADQAIQAVHVELLFYPYYRTQCWYYDVALYLVAQGYALKAMWPMYWGGRLRYAQAFFERSQWT
jgi:FkbM family methyltransferase